MYINPFFYDAVQGENIIESLQNLHVQIYFNMLWTFSCSDRPLGKPTCKFTSLVLLAGRPASSWALLSVGWSCWQQLLFSLDIAGVREQRLRRKPQSSQPR